MGQPTWLKTMYPTCRGVTRGTETSKSGGKENNSDSASSGERTRTSPKVSMVVRIQDFHLLRFDFPDNSTPNIDTLGLVRVRSPLLAESLLFSFPPGT